MRPCLDYLFTEIYDAESNTCLDFTVKAWPVVTGGDMRLAELREGSRWPGRAIMRQFKQVPGPTVSPSVVLMETLEGGEHMGICFDLRLLDLSEQGVRCLLMDCYAGQYRAARFYQ